MEMGGRVLVQFWQLASKFFFLNANCCLLVGEEVRMGTFFFVMLSYQ